MYHNGHNNKFGSSTTTIISSFINLSKSFLLRVCHTGPHQEIREETEKMGNFLEEEKSNKETFISSKTDSLFFFLHLIP